MPHRVTNFLRSSSANPSHRKKRTTAADGGGGGNPSSASSGSSRNNSLAPSPYASDSDDHHHAVKMPDNFADALRSYNRLSLTFGRRVSREHGHASSASALTLDWSIESPPIVFHGSPDESTGALVSGQVIMDVKEETVDVGSLVATLSLHTTHKRPCQSHCLPCQHRSTDLKTWRLLAQPTATTLARGRHSFPFSALLEGHLPASLDTSVLSIAYAFKAEAIVVRGHGNSCASVRFERSLDVKRSLPEPLYPHHSIRVFPPTNIKASAHYNTVIHPTGSNGLTLRLDGLMSHDEEKPGWVYLWRLKKVNWRLNETIHTIAPPCDKHAAAAPVVGRGKKANSNLDDDDEDEDDAAAPDRPKKGETRTETRLLGEKQLQEGWKSDYTGADGTVDMEFDYCINQFKSHSRTPKYACDLKTRDGTEVTHSLAIELIVSKEYAPEGRLHLATQSGTGRILRMSFAVVLTECPGLGVSWDNEAPPVYQDVPPSPPGYPQDEARGRPIDYDDLEPLDAQRASVDPPELPRQAGLAPLSEESPPRSEQSPRAGPAPLSE
ncbi:hypothetical protein HRG_008430 [Hirsutella rhossiliensis]|uniref:LDB19 N-terminal domain-containing protein n=1 Tax=Hirsutella rhossiliensis TaxID=111463 RepID=A0A9P8SGA8_9HYPO|nr:uncharacterized protein HRG_08430 [Hirsutella rhossiliensis]KAH0960275.1 hypothetical protein HRG_08430 [Hirsutella rhossiliensis]